MRITQSWSKIAIVFETEVTRSHSSMAALDDDSGLHPHLCDLRYTYHVEPKPGHAIGDRIGPHSGLARLSPKKKDWAVLEGDWFNDYGYHRYGSYYLERQDRSIDVHEWMSGEAHCQAVGLSQAPEAAG